MVIMVEEGAEVEVVAEVTGTGTGSEAGAPTLIMDFSSTMVVTCLTVASLETGGGIEGAEAGRISMGDFFSSTMVVWIGTSFPFFSSLLPSFMRPIVEENDNGDEEVSSVDDAGDVEESIIFLSSITLVSDGLTLFATALTSAGVDEDWEDAPEATSEDIVDDDAPDVDVDASLAGVGLASMRGVVIPTLTSIVEWEDDGTGNGNGEANEIVG